ncbi:MAG TPA: glycosyl transferase family 1, partial [Casimicrobiaceae bacterium]|nr:glycosyl transferase family 1 [Casimicrobiaceae bacterium]
MSRILIFAEAVTLAHVARPIALSRILRELGHEVCIAAAPAADRWLAGENVGRVRIESIESTRFLRALARGVPPYDRETLKRYVEDDLRAIATWPPDIVIGDFRLSLYISARLARKPYGAIANAYWSRRYWTGVDAPDISSLNWLPSPIANAVFRAVYPAAFAWHARAFHSVCRHFAVTPPGRDIRDIYTASDVTAFADVEALYEPSPTRADAPLFIGPLPWEPPGANVLPELSEGAPIVFVSLGSSGDSNLLPRVLHAVAGWPVRCIVATGVPVDQVRLPVNCIHAAEFVPYAAACAASSLVICNGGAPATYSALAAGKPVVALPGNVDQLANMQAVIRKGAG